MIRQLLADIISSALYDRCTGVREDFFLFFFSEMLTLTRRDSKFDDMQEVSGGK